MKKIFVILAVGFALVSCKKDYTCTCTSKYNYNGSTESYESKFRIEDASKKQAQLACIEANISSSESGYSSEQTCVLKK